MLVGSSGGHLAQLMALEPWWSTWRRTWVTFDTADAVSLLEGEKTVWAHHPTTRNVKNAMRNMVLAVRLLRAERPDIVVSTGAAAAVPFFLVARALGVPTVFIEVYDRIDTATLTGRLCRPLATMICVQWEEQLKLYPRARVIGGLL
ncbi:MAG TPA: PssD/Cps14F family polysaccharide biosynthesis glycosyltransferase [Marmoricola sp.]|nr:PssD/Cps14F family polysaccharide biosynthesis glycosyltransferase [Marmoricola sp.]